MSSAKKRAYVTKGCVACGSCEKVCRLKAIAVHKGIVAIVNKNACVGCGLCAKACPAGIIEIGVRAYEEAVV